MKEEPETLTPAIRLEAAFQQPNHLRVCKSPVWMPEEHLSQTGMSWGVKGLSTLPLVPEQKPSAPS